MHIFEIIFCQILFGIEASMLRNKVQWLRSTLKSFIWRPELLQRLWAKVINNISHHFNFCNFYTISSAQIEISIFRNNYCIWIVVCVNSNIAFTGSTTRCQVKLHFWPSNPNWIQQLSKYNSYFLNDKFQINAGYNVHVPTIFQLVSS